MAVYPEAVLLQGGGDIVLPAFDDAGSDEDAGGSQECEAGTQISRCFTLCDEDEQQCAQTVHEQNDSGVDAEQEGNQYRCTEHGKHVLQAQRKQHRQGDSFIHLDDSFTFQIKNLLMILFLKNYLCKYTKGWMMVQGLNGEKLEFFNKNVLFLI